MRPIEALRTPESLNKSDTGSAITIGVFDGLHLGHMQLIRTLKDVSKEIQSIVITFSKHPLSVLDSSFAPKYLCSVKFTNENSILMVVCDKHYDFKDYLESFDDYIKYLRKL